MAERHRDNEQEEITKKRNRENEEEEKKLEKNKRIPYPICYKLCDFRRRKNSRILAEELARNVDCTTARNKRFSEAVWRETRLKINKTS